MKKRRSWERVCFLLINIRVNVPSHFPRCLCLRPLDFEEEEGGVGGVKGGPDVSGESLRFLTVTVNSRLQQKGKVRITGDCLLPVTFNLPSKPTLMSRPSSVCAVTFSPHASLSLQKRRPRFKTFASAHSSIWSD